MYGHQSGGPQGFPAHLVRRANHLEIQPNYSYLLFGLHVHLGIFLLKQSIESMMSTTWFLDLVFDVCNHI